MSHTARATELWGRDLRPAMMTPQLCIPIIERIMGESDVAKEELKQAMDVIESLQAKMANLDERNAVMKTKNRNLANRVKRLSDAASEAKRRKNKDR